MTPVKTSASEFHQAKLLWSYLVPGESSYFWKQQGLSSEGVKGSMSMLPPVCHLCQTHVNVYVMVLEARTRAVYQLYRARLWVHKCKYVVYVFNYLWFSHLDGALCAYRGCFCVGHMSSSSPRSLFMGWKPAESFVDWSSVGWIPGQENFRRSARCKNKKTNMMHRDRTQNSWGFVSLLQPATRRQSRYIRRTHYDYYVF